MVLTKIQSSLKQSEMTFNTQKTTLLATQWFETSKKRPDITKK